MKTYILRWFCVVVGFLGWILWYIVDAGGCGLFEDFVDGGCCCDVVEVVLVAA